MVEKLRVKKPALAQSFKQHSISCLAVKVVGFLLPFEFSVIGFAFFVIYV